MLAACAKVLTLSTTMPLVPPPSARVMTPVPVVPVGNPPVMSKALIQPPVMVAEQLAETDTKRNSVPLGPTLGLWNVVSGEHPWAPLVTSWSGPSLGVLFRVEPVNPILHTEGLAALEPLPSVPHTYKWPELGPLVK